MASDHVYEYSRLLQKCMGGGNFKANNATSYGIVDKSRATDAFDRMAFCNCHGSCPVDINRPF